MNKVSKSEFWYLAISFAALKILIHLVTNTNYELHRDAFLYLAQGEHLSWGYLSVPPLNALLSKGLRLITGDSVFAVRLFPTLIGSVSVIIINLIVKEMGGKKWAMILASLAFIFSPAFLRSNMLFQPVSLNQFFWLTSFYFIIRLINTQNPKFWIFLSINFALGFLAKYSIVFLALGFFISLLLTPHRRLILNKYFLYGILIGLVIVSPNIFWQYQNGWPVAYHMSLLIDKHLVNVSWSEFILDQLIMNLPVTFFWFTGLLYLIFYSGLKKYRIIGFTYLAVISLLIIMKGKSYYSIGLYSVLFATGGIVFEKYVHYKILTYLNLAFMIVITIYMLPFSLTIYGHERMLAFCEKTIERGVDMPMRWEDGEIHALPQDYADMIGWKELGSNVEKVYNTLSDEQKEHCYIYAENYGQAGAISYYGQKSGLPDPISFHGSFIFWAPDEIKDIRYFIYVNDNIDGIKDYFEEIKKYEGITNPYARERGLPIYLCINPSDEFLKLYRSRLAEEFARFKQ